MNDHISNVWGLLSRSYLGVLDLSRLAQSRMNLNSLVKKYKEEHLESTGQILCVAGRISLLKELTSYTTGYLLNQD